MTQSYTKHIYFVLTAVIECLFICFYSLMISLLYFLAFAMYNIAFTGIILSSVMNIVNIDQVSKIIFRTVGVLYGSFTCSVAFALPRLLQVKKEQVLASRQQVRNNDSTQPTSITEGSAMNNSGSFQMLVSVPTKVISTMIQVANISKRRGRPPPLLSESVVASNISGWDSSAMEVPVIDEKTMLANTETIEEMNNNNDNNNNETNNATTNSLEGSSSMDQSSQTNNKIVGNQPENVTSFLIVKNMDENGLDISNLQDDDDDGTSNEHRLLASPIPLLAKQDNDDDDKSDNIVRNIQENATCMLNEHHHDPNDKGLAASSTSATTIATRMSSSEVTTQANDNDDDDFVVAADNDDYHRSTNSNCHHPNCPIAGECLSSVINVLDSISDDSVEHEFNME
jgi:hypothetical protein